MSAKFYNIGCSARRPDLEPDPEQVSLPEVKARLVSQINVNEIVAEPELPKRWRPELMSRDETRA